MAGLSLTVEAAHASLTVEEARLAAKTAATYPPGVETNLWGSDARYCLVIRAEEVVKILKSDPSAADYG